MNHVMIRDYTPADFDAVVDLTAEAFVAVSMRDASPATAARMARIFTHESLALSTRARLAEVDGDVVGLAFADVHGHPRLPGVWGHRVSMAADAAKILFTGAHDLPLIREQLRVIGSYKALRANARATITDELKLFAVAARARGLGVGGRLFDDFTDHLVTNGRTRFHLYTDTDCTYGFYDARGMTRDAALTLKLRGRTAERELGVFLYSGDARSVRRSGQPQSTAPGR